MKIKELQKILVRENIDCAVFGPTTNMRYLLGYAPHADERLCLLIITPEDSQLIVPKLNAEDIAEHTDLPMITWEDAEGPGKALEQSVLSRKSGRVTSFDGSMRADFLLTLLDLYAPERNVSADPLVAEMRVIKTPEEIEGLAAAAAQADRAMQAGVDACRPGITEAEVAWAVEEAFRKDGAEQVMFTLVAAGKNGALPHHSSGSMKMKAGDGIILDIGASMKGYKSDITRAVFLGEPDKKFLEVHETVKTANEAGRNAVKAGTAAEEVDRAARQVIAEAGYEEYFIHRTGHGLGLDIHETPWIMEGNRQILKEGMVFSVEPGIYLPGKFGVRVEDIVAVEESGHRLLTGFDHSLVIK